MLQAITRNFERLVRSDYAYFWIFAGSILETTIIPIPIELVLIPLMATDRVRLWGYAFAAFAGCMVAAGAMYAMGFFLFETVGRDVVAFFGADSTLESFRSSMDKGAFWAILAVGITPVPFQIAAIGAGVAQYSFVLFLLAAGLARGVRYFGLALLVWWAGDAAGEIIRKHSTAIMIVASLIGLGFLVRAVMSFL